MADWYDVWPIEKYINETEMLLQDKGGKLREHVSTKGGYSGTGVRPVKQWGATTYNVYDYATDRKSDTPDIATPADARWVVPYPIEWGELISDFDRDNLDDDPLGSVLQAGAAAVQRGEDDIILQSIFMDAKTGLRGGTTTTFDANNTVPVSIGGADTGLNHAKLRAGIELLLGNEAQLFEGDELNMAIGEQEWNALFGENQTVSSDFIDSRPTLTAKLPNLYSINFIPFSEARLAAQGTAYRDTNVLTLPMWMKSGVHLGLWRDREVKVLQRADKRGDPHPYIRQTVGGTRLQEGKVVKVQCYRAT